MSTSYKASMGQVTSKGQLLGGSSKYPGDKHQKLKLDPNSAKNFLHFLGKSLSFTELFEKSLSNYQSTKLDKRSNLSSYNLIICYAWGDIGLCSPYQDPEI